MRKLEEKYRDELVVIGVHSAKFPTEAETANIRAAILRHNLAHPVVNDAGFRIWQAYGVSAWPTLVLIGPDGRVLDVHAGEITFESYEHIFARYLNEYDTRGMIDRRHLDLRPERLGEAASPLYFPGKLLCDPQGDRLFIADTGHHRILAVKLDSGGLSGSVQQAIGTGQPGFEDGPAAAAAFNEPRGMALEGSRLYVADTENHAIRLIDLESLTVTTVAGTGRQASYGARGGPGAQTALSSPWDVLLAGRRLFIAMAGSHQIWVYNLDSGEADPWAGTGQEALIDGPLMRAALNQPSGICAGGDRLYLADSEASAIRWLDIDPHGAVGTIVGTGLFDFGDRDGAGDDVRLQHPLAVSCQTAPGNQHLRLFIADSYNNKIKVLDPRSRSCISWAGTGARGRKDGRLVDAQFNEPAGLSISGELLYVADTDNHLVRAINIRERRVSTVELKNVPAARMEAPTAAGTRLPAQSIGVGAGTIVVDIKTAPEQELNLDEPFYASWLVDNQQTVIFKDGQSVSGPHPSLPLRIEADFQPGEALVKLDLTIFYCRHGERLCLIDTPLLELPLRVDTQSGEHEATIEYVTGRRNAGGVR